MTIEVQGAIDTPEQVSAFGSALLDELAHVLPTLGFSPTAVVLTQHDPRPDGVQPGLLAVLGEGYAETQMLDLGRGGLSTFFNEVLPTLEAGTPAPSRTSPPAPQTSAVAAPAAPQATSAPQRAAEPAPAPTSTDRVWAAFEEAVRPQLGRGAAKAVAASRKAAAGKSDAEIIEFLSERLANFGPQALETFRSGLN